MLRAAIAWLAYPCATGGAVAFCLWALARAWPAWAIGAVVVGAMSLATPALERLAPYSSAWARARGDRATDVWHYAISNRAFDLGTFAAIAIMTPARDALAARTGVALWPHAWPLVLQAALALALFELPWYAVHRLEHTWRPLWRVHAVHHSPTRMYWWNLARNHPIDNLLSAIVSMAPLVVLGVPDAPLALFAAFAGAHGMLQHSNVDLRTGFLDLFFTTARVHRWHHSPVLEESRANYGPTITLWDWLFGTRRFDPERTPPERTGLGRDDFPEGFVAQMRAPFDAKLWER